jgi:hypothetical protein
MEESSDLGATAEEVFREFRRLGDVPQRNTFVTDFLRHPL